MAVEVPGLLGGHLLLGSPATAGNRAGLQDTPSQEPFPQGPLGPRVAVCPLTGSSPQADPGRTHPPDGHATVADVLVRGWQKGVKKLEQTSVPVSEHKTLSYL